jgi:uncharacterized membrane protein YkoI
MWFLKVIKALLLVVCLLSVTEIRVSHALQTSNAYNANGISQTKAIEIARNLVEGRVLRVEKTTQSYKIKILQSSGRVVSVSVNRITGKVENAKALKQ